MLGPATARVQFLISGKVGVLFLLAVSSLGLGYYWYAEQQETLKRQEETRARFKAPPYFINLGESVIRSCQRCLDLGKLKPQSEWRVGPPKEIPREEQRWFMSVEDPALPTPVAGVLMLAVFATLGDDPILGFDQGHVWLVLYQSLQRMPAIQQLPALQPTAVASTQPAPAPEATEPTPGIPAVVSQERPWYIGDWKNDDSETRGVTRFSIARAPDGLTLHAWGKCSPVDCDWKETAATVSNDVLSVLWDKGFASCAWRVSQESDGRLKVSEHIHFNDGRRDVDATRFFSRSSEGQQ